MSTATSPSQSLLPQSRDLELDLKTSGERSRDFAEMAQLWLVNLSCFAIALLVPAAVGTQRREGEAYMFEIFPLEFWKSVFYLTTFATDCLPASEQK